MPRPKTAPKPKPAANPPPAPDRWGGLKPTPETVREPLDGPPPGPTAGDEVRELRALAEAGLRTAVAWVTELTADGLMPDLALQQRAQAAGWPPEYTALVRARMGGRG